MYILQKWIMYTCVCVYILQESPKILKNGDCKLDVVYICMYIYNLQTGCCIYMYVYTQVPLALSSQRTVVGEEAEDEEEEAEEEGEGKGDIVKGYTGKPTQENVI